MFYLLIVCLEIVYRKVDDSGSRLPKNKSRSSWPMSLDVNMVIFEIFEPAESILCREIKVNDSGSRLPNNKTRSWWPTSLNVNLAIVKMFQSAELIPHLLS